MDNTVGSRQGEIIIGTLLGDACLERNGKNVRLVIVHSAKQRFYVEWKSQQLKDFGGKVIDKQRFDVRTNKFYSYSAYRTHSLQKLEGYYSLFYKNGIKRIPPVLPKIITPQILAIWFMDDGYKRNDCNAARLNTQGYSAAEHIIIQKALLALGISSKIHKQKHLFVTYIPSSSMKRLRQQISGFIIPNMEYKIV